jgi:hypothetical protein
MSRQEVRRVWYVAYGSNLALERFRCYLRGGPVPGGARVYPGCRDPQQPADVAALSFPGRLVFSGRSRVWGGGIAFHDSAADGEVAGRGYLVTPAQLADVVAQETRQPPGGTVAFRIEARLGDGTAPAQAQGWGGNGLYDTLTVLGHHDGTPLVTITHGAVATMSPVAPSAAYLHWIRIGLRQAHGWDDDWIDRYLARMPGVEPRDGDAAPVLH